MSDEPTSTHVTARGAHGVRSAVQQRTERRRAPERRASAAPVGRCPACEGIAVLQEKWVLHIVHALLDGPKGFNAIGREVGGCNPTTLTQRLGRLEQLGIIAKEHGDGRCRACYRLTRAGEHLEDVIAAIHRWADAHLPVGPHSND